MRVYEGTRDVISFNLTLENALNLIDWNDVKRIQIERWYRSESLTDR